MNEPDELAKMPHLNYLCEAGFEEIELVMRGAMDDEVELKHQLYNVPASKYGGGAFGVGE